MRASDRIFYVLGDHDWSPKPGYEHTHVCLCKQDAIALLEWLGFAPNLRGLYPLSEVRARCRRRLWDVPRNYDEGTIIYETQADGSERALYYRRPHSLRAITQQLLTMVESRMLPDTTHLSIMRVP
jgi:hypothetical protein